MIAVIWQIRTVICLLFTFLSIVWLPKPLAGDCACYVGAHPCGRPAQGRRRGAPLWSPCTGQAQGTAPTGIKSDIVNVPTARISPCSRE